MVNNKNKFLIFLTAIIFTIGLFAVGYGNTASAFVWTDPVLTANATKIRKIHIDQLRTNINTKRQVCGLGNYSWTDPVLTPNVTKIRVTHFNEMRQAIKDVYIAASVAPPVFTDSTLTANVTKIRAVHINELRSATDNAPACGWTQLFPSGSAPNAQINLSAVWDSARSKMYLYGFGAATPLSSRFTSYDIAANSWAQIVPSGSFPPGRWSHSAVWDSTRDKMFVFAGYQYTVGNLNDLWSYSATTNSWTQLFPSGTAPVARQDHSAVLDSARNKMYVFGGKNQFGTLLNDLWSYDIAANSWTQLSPSGTAPALRRLHSAVWNSAGSKMYVFGGIDATGSRNDLWSYDAVANSWTQLAPSGSIPTARQGHTAVWDSARSRMYVFDGGNSTTGTLNDLWSYDATANSWTKLSPAGTIPPKRQNQSMIWDSTRNKMYVFGGSDAAWLTDLWGYAP